MRRKEEQEIQGVSSKKAIGALVDLEQEEGAEVAHSCTRFPCYLGMEINAKTQWTTTKIVELGN